LLSHNFTHHYMDEDILQKAQLYVSNLFDNQLSPKNYYHNFKHTNNVVTSVSQLSKMENCNDNDTFLLKLAAWFHDSGYTEIDEGHEDVSIKILHQFLKTIEIVLSDIAIVEQLILVTKMSSAPKSKLEKIMKDADCAHLSFPDFLEISEQLRLELQYKSETKISKSEWLRTNINFMSQHTFYTKQAQTKWTPLKEINLFNLKQKTEKNKTKKEEPKKTGKGVETMFRVTLKNHIQLSAIADTKANILLSVNAIIISVALSNLIPKLDNISNQFLVYPTLILMFFSVASVVLSVLSTRPNVSSVHVTKDMIKQNKTNILFFGNFHKMSLKEFEWGIEYLMDNEETLYNSMTKDLYFLGLVLERKYRLLRTTYTVFMIGIIISAISFVASYHYTINIH